MVSVIVPTRNERDNIWALVERLDRVLPGAAEIIFVDDSTDETPEAVRRSARWTRRTVALVHRPADQRRGGLGGAVVCGLTAARGRWACVMDGDLQHPPEVVPRLLEEARRSGADAVVASRYAGHGTVGEFGRVRRLLSRGSAMLARLLFFRRLRRVSDPMSGFFLVRREAIDPCVLRPRGFKILLEILVRSRLGTIREVPFAFGLRHAGASKASLREAARYVGQLLRLRAGERALRFARFAIVGATGIVVNTVVLFTLIELTHLYYLVSAFLATQVSITSNYLLSERWVFSGSGAERSVRWRLATFFLMSNAALGLGGPTLFVLVSVLGVRYLLANLVTIAIVAGVRFAAADAWIWRAAAHRAPAHAAEPAPAVRLGPEAEPAATIAA